MVDFLFNLKGDVLIGPLRHCKTDSLHYENDHKKALDVICLLYISAETTLTHFQLSFKECTRPIESSSNTAKSASP